MEVLLSLGPKFALPVTSIQQIPFYHLLSDVESILKTNPDTTIQDRNRCAIANTILNYIHHNNRPNTKLDPNEKFFNTAEKVTRRFLRENPDVLIIPSDKGNKTVLISSVDYRQKMLLMVGDQQTYERIPRDPTNRYQNQNNSLVQRLRALNLIDDRTARSLKTYSAVCPRIYGQPKAHKTGLPLRPVVPNMTAPSYNLAKFVGKILQQSIDSEYNIKNSFSFCDFINGLQLPAGHVLVSLDVTSLFTSIPKSLVIANIRLRWDDIARHTNINLSLFVELVEFCIDSSYFVYEGQHYHQKFGTAMGNPLSPVVADLVMEILLDTVKSNLDFVPGFIRKYVDDLILSIPLEELPHLLQTFNSYDPHIQFTHELEESNKLPYLDMVLVRHQDQKVTTEWYIKPIASGRFLDFLSYHPLKMKMNVAKNFIGRVNYLSTNLTEAEKGRIIDEHLKLNHYPTNLRHRLANRMNERRQTSNDDQEHLEYTYRSLAYIPHLSNSIDKLLKKDYKNIKLANYNTKTVKCMYSKVKDAVPKGHQTNVIYSIPCKNCPACYIGMTTNRLNTRMSGHRTHYNTLDRLIAANVETTDPQITLLSQRTALLEHSIQQNHRFDLENAKIIDQHNKQYKLPLLEVCHIVNSDNSINRRTDTEGLSAIYAGILHSIKNRTNTNNHHKTNSNQNPQPPQPHNNT